MKEKDKQITGIMFAYNFICERKLWFYSNDIAMEKGNEYIEIGKNIDYESYKREKKNIIIDNMISIDFISNGVVCEVKKSKSQRKAAIYQIKYYLYVLYKHGVDNPKGILKIPKTKYTESVDLSPADIKFIEQKKKEITKLIKSEKVPKEINSSICKKCAYYEICKI